MSMTCYPEMNEDGISVRAEGTAFLDLTGYRLEV